MADDNSQQPNPWPERIIHGMEVVGEVAEFFELGAPALFSPLGAAAAGGYGIYDALNPAERHRYLQEHLQKLNLDHANKAVVQSDPAPSKRADKISITPATTAVQHLKSEIGGRGGFKGATTEPPGGSGRSPDSMHVRPTAHPTKYHPLPHSSTPAPKGQTPENKPETSKQKPHVHALQRKEAAPATSLRSGITPPSNPTRAPSGTQPSFGSANQGVAPASATNAGVILGPSFQLLNPNTRPGQPSAASVTSSNGNQTSGLNPLLTQAIASMLAINAQKSSAQGVQPISAGVPASMSPHSAETSKVQLTTTSGPKNPALASAVASMLAINAAKTQANASPPAVRPVAAVK